MSILKVKKAIVIIHSSGPDEINLDIEAHSIMPTMYPNCVPHFHATAEKGKGVQWVRDNLKMEPEVIYY